MNRPFVLVVVFVIEDEHEHEDEEVHANTVIIGPRWSG